MPWALHQERCFNRGGQGTTSAGFTDNSNANNYNYQFAVEAASINVNVSAATVPITPTPGPCSVSLWHHPAHLCVVLQWQSCWWRQSEDRQSKWPHGVVVATYPGGCVATAQYIVTGYTPVTQYSPRSEVVQ